MCAYIANSAADNPNGIKKLLESSEVTFFINGTQAVINWFA